MVGAGTRRILRRHECYHGVGRVGVRYDNPGPFMGMQHVRG